jgi:tetratricopeptide (TPR) repeat protein
LDVILPALGAQLAKRHAWKPLTRLVDSNLLDRLNERGSWKEYVLLTGLRIDAADELGDTVSVVQLCCQLARKMAQMGDVESAWELVHRAEHMLGETGSAALRADVHSHRAFLAYVQGDARFALKELAICSELRIGTADTMGVLVSYKLEGNIRLRQGDHQGAAAAYRAALAVAQMPGDLKHRLDAETSLAACEMHLGAEDSAERRLQRTIQRMRASQIDTELPRAMYVCALLAEQRGRPGEALELARQAAHLQGHDEGVQMAVNRLIWRLERFPEGVSRSVGPEAQETK